MHLIMYQIWTPSQNLVDNTTQIDELRTIFIDDVTLVYIEGMEWSPVSVEDVEDDGNTTNIMKWETSVNGEIQATGEIDLSDVNRELPTSFEAGSIQVKQKQTSTVTVTVYLDTTTSSNSNNYQTYRREYVSFHYSLFYCSHWQHVWWSYPCL